MVTKPPGSVSGHVAFLLVDELIRTLLSKDERIALIERVTATAGNLTVGPTAEILVSIRDLGKEYLK